MNVLKTFKEVCSEHSSKICTVGAIVGLGFTVYKTWVARPKVDAIVAEREEKLRAILQAFSEVEMDDAAREDQKKQVKELNRETNKKIAVATLPIGIAAGATVGLTVASEVINSKKIADMAATISMGDLAYEKLLKKTQEMIGTEKTNEITTAIAEENIKEDQDIKWVDPEYGDIELDTSGIEQGYGGSQVFYDMMLGCLFKSDVHTIEKACLQMNGKMAKGKETYFTYNEFRNEIGLNSVCGADYFGWGLYAPIANSLEPNLCNAIVIGNISVIVLDWMTRPSSSYKG